MKLKSITFDATTNKLFVTIEWICYGVIDELDPNHSHGIAVPYNESVGENIVWNNSGVDNQCSLICCNEMSSIAEKFKIPSSWDLTEHPLQWWIIDKSTRIKTEDIDSITCYFNDGTSATRTGVQGWKKYTYETILELDLSTSFISIQKDLLFVFISVLDNTKEERPITTYVFPYYLPSAYNKIILDNIKNGFKTDCCEGLNTCLINHLLAKYGFEYAFNLRDCQTMIKYWNIIHEQVTSKSNTGCGCGR